jgi:hypothetical protein
MIDYADGEDVVATKRTRGVQLFVASIAQDSVDGPRIPAEEQPKYVALLVKKDFRNLQRVVKIARQLNGLVLGGTAAAQEKLKND